VLLSVLVEYVLMMESGRVEGKGIKEGIKVLSSQ
jgi:hypothetical protein